VGKGAAFIVDSRDPGRHIQDAATLFASIGKVGDLELDALSKNDRKRLTVLVRALSSDTAVGWGHLEDDFRSRGQRTLQRRGQFSLSLSTQQAYGGTHGGESPIDRVHNVNGKNN